MEHIAEIGWATVNVQFDSDSATVHLLSRAVSPSRHGVRMIRFARRFRDLGIDGKKARQYDEFSRKHRMDDFVEYAHLAARHLASNGSALDVATGPGYFCVELAKLGKFMIVGIDISRDLLEIACGNARNAGTVAAFQQSNASEMPFSAEVFDFIFCSWSVKNFMEPTRVLTEMHRVLRPGGVAHVVDLNHDASSGDWRSYAYRRGLRGAAGLSMRVAFAIQRRGAYSTDQLRQMVADTPFRNCDIQTDGINLCVYLSK